MDDLWMISGLMNTLHNIIMDDSTIDGLTDQPPISWIIFMILMMD